MGEERRLHQGLVVFKQFMRPTARQTMVPPFRLVYFDPEAAAYKVLTTSPIPLKVMPSTSPSALPGSIAAIPQAADGLMSHAVPLHAATTGVGTLARGNE
jgi:hypothetical protein